jgi:predicted GIY-YIG superfamily endonuclease
MYFVYVIRSETADRIYIGHTADLEKRLREHNDPACFTSKFTKRVPGPVVVGLQRDIPDSKHSGVNAG